MATAVFKDPVELAEEGTPVALHAEIDRPRQSFLAAHIARHNARQRRADEALGEQTQLRRR